LNCLGTFPHIFPFASLIRLPHDYFFRRPVIAFPARLKMAVHLWLYFFSFHRLIFPKSIDCFSVRLKVAFDPMVYVSAEFGFSFSFVEIVYLKAETNMGVEKILFADN
jgi:hypothetical protein